MFDSYFSATIAPDPLLWSQHDPWLVALSVLVSMGASAVALHMAVLARAAESRGLRRLALGSGAKGDYDEVAIYDHALAPERVLAHYAAGRP